MQQSVFSRTLITLKVKGKQSASSSIRPRHVQTHDISLKLKRKTPYLHAP